MVAGVVVVCAVGVQEVRALGECRRCRTWSLRNVSRSLNVQQSGFARDMCSVTEMRFSPVWCGLLARWLTSGVTAVLPLQAPGALFLL
jgi:hypothetical protein